MAPLVFILADDLTGSADAANYFRGGRRRVRVTFTGDAPWDFTLGADVVQVRDTESRSLPPAEARRRVEHAASPLARKPGPSLVFKKVDSTLRGNVGIELETALRALDRPLAVLAPAFPANRRVVRGGRLFVDGIPVTQTSLGRDPRTPIRADRVADVIHETCDLALGEIGLDQVRAGSAHLGERLRDLPGPGIAVCDAETQDDLDTIAMAIGTSSTLPAGSAGLARAIAAVWRDRHGEPGPERPARARCGEVLVAVGTINPVAHEQLAVLRQTIGLSIVTLRPRALASAASRASEVTRACAQAVRFGGPILAVAVSGEQIEEAVAGRAPYFEEDLARVGAAWLESRPIREAEALGLVCTGGATTLAVCRALGAQAIWPEGEISPGLPWSAIEGPRRTMLLASKAGGFGTPAALRDAVRFLTGE